MTHRPLAALLVVALMAGGGHATPFADRVVGFEIGTGGGAGRDRMPGIVLGPPHGGGAFHGATDTFSLGLGGWIVLRFDTPIVDGPGPDFTVFENAFLTAGLQTGPPFAEPGKVSVSADGATWTPFPCQLDAPPYYPGCAGVYPVFADAGDPSAPSPLIPCTIPIEQLVGVALDGFVPPACSGGDSFDLADVGLGLIRFVRIDASQLQPGLGGEAGFDLDAIAAIHSAAEPPTVSTTTIPEAATTTTTMPVTRCDSIETCYVALGTALPTLSGEVAKTTRRATAKLQRKYTKLGKALAKAASSPAESRARRYRKARSLTQKLLAVASRYNKKRALDASLPGVQAADAALLAQIPS